MQDVHRRLACQLDAKNRIEPKRDAPLRALERMAGLLASAAFALDLVEHRPGLHAAIADAQHQPWDDAVTVFDTAELWSAQLL